MRHWFAGKLRRWADRIDPRRVITEADEATLIGLLRADNETRRKIGGNE